MPNASERAGRWRCSKDEVGIGELCRCRAHNDACRGVYVLAKLPQLPRSSRFLFFCSGGVANARCAVDKLTSGIHQVPSEPYVARTAHNAKDLRPACHNTKVFACTCIVGSSIPNLLHSTARLSAFTAFAVDTRAHSAKYFAFKQASHNQNILHFNPLDHCRRCLCEWGGGWEMEHAGLC